MSGHRTLVPLRVTPEGVVGTVVGLRPFRREGFRVEVERLGGKVVIHHYGHGGCGVTLSWGTAQIALEHALETPHRSVAVLGAGAVGLATARLFQQHGFTVTVYARDLPPSTTSNVAGAEWAPRIVIDEDRRTSRFDEQLVRAARIAHRRFRTLVGDDYGIRWVDAYEIGTSASSGSGWRESELLPDLFANTPLAPADHVFGERPVGHYRSLHIDPAVYLSAVMAEVRRAGARIVVSELADVADVLALAQPLVVNCTGLGARELFADEGLIAIKGQLVILRPQPGVDYLSHTADGALYMMPRRSEIILGGTEQRGVETREPDRMETARILGGHRALFANTPGTGDAD